VGHRDHGAEEVEESPHEKLKRHETKSEEQKESSEGITSFSALFFFFLVSFVLSL
jgi:hypothetical protein